MKKLILISNGALSLSLFSLAIKVKITSLKLFNVLLMDYLHKQ